MSLNNLKVVMEANMEAKSQYISLRTSILSQHKTISLELNICFLSRELGRILHDILNTDQTAYLSNNQDGRHMIRCHKAC